MKQTNTDLADGVVRTNSPVSTLFHQSLNDCEQNLSREIDFVLNHLIDEATVTNHCRHCGWR